MNTLLFVEVRKSIAQWVNNKSEELKNKNISIEILKNNDECLRIEFNFGEVLAEILVTEDDYSPWHFVFFQAGDIVDGVPKMIHDWYDNDKTTIEEIIENLDKSIDIVFKYHKEKYNN